MRPFYFFVVLWGERFRNYFVDYCLPSLLAPGNIPSLIRGPAHKFLIATTPEDWQAMRDLQVFQLLATYVEPVLIEIPPAPAGCGPCVHMGIGHKLATEMCFRDRAYGVLVTPDLMLSDGTMAAAQQHACAGREIVLVAAQRFGEEPLFAELAALGLIQGEERLSESGRPLTLTGRQLVRAAVNSFHSELLTYEWDAPYFASFPCAAWWRVPGEDGIVMHSFSWAPILIDYAAVREHNTTALETWTIDGDYVWRNFANIERIHVVQDSDEAMLVSWTPLGDRTRDLRPDSLQQSRLFGEWTKGSILRSTYFNPIFDPVKRKIFPLPVRWHADDFSPTWMAVEKKARHLIDRYIHSVEQRASAPGMILWFMTRAAAASLSVSCLVILTRAKLAYYLPTMLAAVKGDRIARARVVRGIKRRLRVIGGIPRNQS